MRPFDRMRTYRRDAEYPQRRQPLNSPPTTETATTCLWWVDPGDRRPSARHHACVLTGRYVQRVEFPRPAGPGRPCPLSGNYLPDPRPTPSRRRSLRRTERPTGRGRDGTGDPEDRGAIRKALVGLLICAGAIVLVVSGTLVWAQSKIPDVRQHRCSSSWKARPPRCGLVRPEEAHEHPAARHRPALRAYRRPATPPRRRPAAAEQRPRRRCWSTSPRTGALEQVVSCPAHSWVPVPGHGRAKIGRGARLAGSAGRADRGDAHRARGPSSMYGTGSGFRALTDLVGGVRDAGAPDGDRQHPRDHLDRGRAPPSNGGSRPSALRRPALRAARRGTWTASSASRRCCAP